MSRKLENYTIKQGVKGNFRHSRDYLACRYYDLGGDYESKEHLDLAYLANNQFVHQKMKEYKAMSFLAAAATIEEITNRT